MTATRLWENADKAAATHPPPTRRLTILKVPIGDETAESLRGKLGV